MFLVPHHTTPSEAEVPPSFDNQSSDEDVNLFPLPLHRLSEGTTFREYAAALLRRHASAMFWLLLHYFRPEECAREVQNLGAYYKERIGYLIWLHALPYLLGLLALFVALDSYVVRLHQRPALGLQVNAFTFLIIEGTIACAVSLVTGIALRVYIGLRSRSPLAVVTSVTVGIVFATCDGGAIWFSRDIVRGIATQLAFALSRDFTWRPDWEVFIPFVSGFAFLIGFLRIYYYPIHLVLLLLPSRYSRFLHPIVWDDCCVLPFFRLSQLLVEWEQRSQGRDLRTIDELITNYPSQRHQALRAQVIIIARRSARVLDLSTLDEIVATLPQGTKGYLNETQKIRDGVITIATMQARLDTMDRTALREPTAMLLCTEIDNFSLRIGGLQEPLATEFRRAAKAWGEIAAKQHMQATQAGHKSTVQVFRAGDPIQREYEAFVPRHSVLGQLEQQILMSRGCPGIVLYGRRRMGKTTTIKNLGGFLPATVIPIIISMQNPASFISLESFILSVTQQTHEALPESILIVDHPGLPEFYEYLCKIDALLRDSGKRLLVALDEYELIDKNIGEGIFPPRLLDTIRQSVQEHRSITWLFAGSHGIAELKHAAWTSYLVSARTVEVPLFSLPETTLLLTDPLKHSSIRLNDSTQRPKFFKGFWGREGIERIHEETAGWPHLVQLVAECIVDIVNEESVEAVDERIFEDALERCLVRGHNVFHELLYSESTMVGEWDYLSRFRKRETQPEPPNKELSDSLRRRLLVRVEDGMLKLRVPLMRRWLINRG